MTTRKKTAGHRRGGGGSNMVPDTSYFMVNNEAWGRPGGGGGGARTKRSGGGANMVGDMPYYAANHSGWNSFSSGVGGGGAKGGAKRGGGGGWAMDKVTRMEGKFDAWAPNAKLIPGTRILAAGHVHVAYPTGKATKVAKLFEDHKRVTWETMAKHLAEIGACFSPWSDGKPGHSPAYTHKG